MSRLRGVSWLFGLVLFTAALSGTDGAPRRLSALTVSPTGVTTLTPAFSPDVYEYSGTVEDAGGREVRLEYTTQDDPV